MTPTCPGEEEGATGIIASDLALEIDGRSIFKTDLALSPGDWLHVWGSVGAGHPQLIQVLAGAIPHTEAGSVSGELRRFGRSRKEARLDELGRWIGYVGTDPRDHIVALRVRDELAWARSSASDAVSGEAYEAFYESSDVGALLERETRVLSTGQRQRVALASCFAAAPRAVMLVDARAPLDETTRALLTRYVQQYTASEAGIVAVADHDPPDPDSACSSQRLHEGRLQESGVEVPETPMEAVLEEFEKRLARARPEPDEALRLGATRVVADHGLRLDIEGLELAPGKVLGLIGHNGAGKSTLVDVTAGLIRPQVGRKLRHSARIGFLWGCDAPRQKSGQRGICHPASVSTHESTRVWRSFQWLAHCAEAGVGFLVLDEPTQGFDAWHRTLLVNVLRAFQAHRCGVLVASHDLSFLEDVSDRVLWLEEGRAKDEGATKDLLHLYGQDSAVL